MTDESSPDNCCQVVFLVDCNPSLWATRSSEEAANTVLLWVLKVLAYFNDHGKGKRSNLRWGYKFFSSRSFSPHVEHHNLKEFSLAVFEEFEKHLSKKLNESFAQQLQSVLGQQDGEAVALAKPPAGAKCISCAFTNVVHDFQWDGPGISSPVRATRGNANLPSNRNTRNVLFLLTGCPCDDSSVEDFGGGIASALTSAESFKNFLMPSVLYREFKKHHICLHWVNVKNVPPDHEKNASLEPLLEAFVQEFGGCVIPLSSLGYGSSCKDLSSCGQINASSFHGSLLPFKTVMDFYLDRNTGELCEVVNSTQRHLSKDLCSPETRGLLCSSGADIKVHCSLRLSSVFQSATKQFCSKNEAGDVQSIVLSGLEASEMPFCPTLVWIRGAINHSQVCPSWLHSVKAYTCIGLDCRLPDSSKNCGSCSKEILSGWFQELLLSLTQGNKSLVVDFLDCESGLPLSGILQPLTSVCGVISVISSHFLVVFEKLFLWNDKMKNAKSVGAFESSVSEFRCKVASKPAEQTMYPEVLIRLIGSHKNPQGTNDASEFRPGIVDPWHPSPVIHDNDKLLWSELRRGIECDSEDDHNSATLMRELKLLNKLEKMKPKSIACKIKQKHEKCKLGVPKTSERNKNLLKMSAIKIKEAVKDKQDTKLDQTKIKAFLEVNSSEECSSTLSSLITVTNGAQKAPCENGDEAQLVTAIHSICDKIIFEGGNIPSEITNIMMSVSNFDQKDGGVRDKNSVIKVLNENVLLTMINLREKYEGCVAASIKEQQVREYQLQILLRTEIAALTSADENSALVEEVTDLLRAISFMKDPNFLAVYLKEVILNRYSQSLAKFLCSVYEGLMMRPPRELLTPSKWSGDDESPLRRSVNSVSSVAQNGCQSRSSGCRVLTRHSSVTDGAAKRREIAVPVKTKPKEKGQQKDKSPHSVCAKAVNRKKNTGSEKTLVRRNLFTEAEEADDSNSTAKIPKKRKISEEENKIQRKRQLNRRNTVGSLSKTAVQETPSHKQVSHALWCKQDRARKRCRAHTEVHVLEESPLKEIQAGDILPRRSPRKASRVMFQRSHSFYGRSASADPLTRSRSFTGERTHLSPQKEHTETSEVLLKTRTPKKMSLTAVSPLRVTPRRKKRFTLHSLLSTSNESEQVIPSSQEPVTPTRRYMATRSSPRLMLKKRSFSCIGFSSVPFPGCQQNESSHLCPELGSVLPDGGSPEIPMKIRKNKITEMDECLVLLTPIKNPLKSPVHTSSKVVADTLSSSQVQSQPCGNGSSDHSDWSSCAHNENLASLENVTHPAIRSSPRLFSKQKISDHPKGTTGQCLVKSTEAKIVKPLAVASPNSPEANSVNLKTPLKDHHFNDCVVLLTPIRGPLTSPVQINRSVAVDDSMSRDPGNLTMNVERWFVTSPNQVKPSHTKSPRSSPQFCLRSSPRNKWKKKSKGLCNSPAETKRLSPLNQILRQQKRKRCLSTSPADRCCIVSKQAKSEKSTYRQDDRELNLLNVSCPVVVDDDNSRSSDEMIDWLTEMQKEYDLTENKATMSPPTKKPRIDKSVVFGWKRTRNAKKSKKESKRDYLSCDTSFEEEDEVFQSPSVMASSLKRRHANKTPLSASSIKILQESPILCNSKSSSRRIRTRYGPSLKSIDHGRMGTSDVSDAFVDD